MTIDRIDKTFTNRFISLGAAQDLTIASGVVTATATYHFIDTEASASTDDLDTINGGVEGDLLILLPASASRTVVFKDGTGNLRLAGDFTADNSSDTITLVKRSTSWRELSRSDNAA